MPHRYKEFLTEHRDCIICGGKYTDTWIKGEIVSAVKCNKCNFVWADPYMNADGIEKYYNGYINDTYGTTKKREQREKQYIIDREFVERFLPDKKIKILEIVSVRVYTYYH